MADTLNINFTFRTEQAPIYWWTIMCDVLASYHFAFDAPDHPAGHGIYTYHRYNPPFTGDADEADEIETVIDSLQAVTDEVCAERGPIIAIFWQTEDNGESMELDFGFTTEKGKKDIGVFIIIPGGQIRDVQIEKARARLTHLFACTNALIEACQPETGEIQWETSSGVLTPWAVIGDTADPLFAPHPYCQPSTVIINNSSNNHWRMARHCFISTRPPFYEDKIKISIGVLFLLHNILLFLTKISAKIYDCPKDII